MFPASSIFAPPSLAPSHGGHGLLPRLHLLPPLPRLRSTPPRLLRAGLALRPDRRVHVGKHGLESSNHVTMFRLSELRPSNSKEYGWASNSGFAILVGSFLNGEFSLFCYGPKEQGWPEKSHLYAWDLPSRFSLSGQDCSISDGILYSQLLIIQKMVAMLPNMVGIPLLAIMWFHATYQCWSQRLLSLP